MVPGKYLLLELDKSEADFYHLPVFVPYLKKHQKNLKEYGLEWELSVQAMKCLVEELDAEEYKSYKLFIRKWSHYELLSNCIKEENWQEAEKEIDKILSIDLLDPSAYLNLGFVFRQIKEYGKAEQAYLKGLELIPYNVPFMAALARTYDEWEKQDEAVKAWKDVLNLSRDNAEALTMLSKYGAYKKVETIINPETRIDYMPAEEFQARMELEYDKAKDDLQKLMHLGLKIVNHDSSCEISKKIFERIYGLSQVENTTSSSRVSPHCFAAGSESTPSQIK